MVLIAFVSGQEFERNQVCVYKWPLKIGKLSLFFLFFKTRLSYHEALTALLPTPFHSVSTIVEKKGTTDPGNIFYNGVIIKGIAAGWEDFMQSWFR